MGWWQAIERKLGARVVPAPSTTLGFLYAEAQDITTREGVMAWRRQVKHELVKQGQQARYLTHISKVPVKEDDEGAVEALREMRRRLTYPV